jgi:hypothetical protein
MKAQTVFNKAVIGLLKQGCKSLDSYGDGDCLYRGHNKARCGVGMLISNTNYKPIMEGNGVRTLVLSGLFPPHLVPHEELLGDIQGVHDSLDVCDWPKAFLAIAENYSLKFDHMKELHNANRNLLAGN